MSDLGHSWSRREFVQGLTVGATAGVLGMHPEEAAAEVREGVSRPDREDDGEGRKAAVERQIP